MSLILLSEAIYSPLGADPDLGDLVDLFVHEMPARISRLQEQLEAANWSDLERTAHQLKGAAGSYGFGPISPVAARVEDAIRSSEPEEQIRQAVEELAEMCARARSGTP